MKRKTWCKHIVWDYFYDDDPYKCWILLEGGGWDAGVRVSKHWKVCPICECERPTRANIKAATLRFLMDNDQ